jgi:hypothetical protein
VKWTSSVLTYLVEKCSIQSRHFANLPRTRKHCWNAKYRLPTSFRRKTRLESPSVRKVGHDSAFKSNRPQLTSKKQIHSSRRTRELLPSFSTRQWHGTSLQRKQLPWHRTTLTLTNSRDSGQFNTYTNRRNGNLYIFSWVPQQQQQAAGVTRQACCSTHRYVQSYSPLQGASKCQ